MEMTVDEAAEVLVGLSRFVQNAGPCADFFCLTSIDVTKVLRASDVIASALRDGEYELKKCDNKS